jgi:hypothetical protein
VITAAEGAGVSFLARGFLGFFVFTVVTVDVYKLSTTTLSTTTFENGHREDESTVKVDAFWEALEVNVILIVSPSV